MTNSFTLLQASSHKDSIVAYICGALLSLAFCVYSYARFIKLSMGAAATYAEQTPAYHHLLPIQATEMAGHTFLALVIGFTGMVEKQYGKTQNFALCSFLSIGMFAVAIIRLFMFS